MLQTNVIFISEACFTLTGVGIALSKNASKYILIVVSSLLVDAQIFLKSEVMLALFTIFKELNKLS